MISLTKGPGQEDDDLEGPAIATVGQVDDERGQPPVAARSDAHGDVPVVDAGADEEPQVVPQAKRGPAPEPDLAPAFVPGVLGVVPVVERPHEPDQPSRLQVDDPEEVSVWGILQLHHKDGYVQEIKNCSQSNFARTTATVQEEFAESPKAIQEPGRSWQTHRRWG